MHEVVVLSSSGNHAFACLLVCLLLESKIGGGIYACSTSFCNSLPETDSKGEGDFFTFVAATNDDKRCRRPTPEPTGEEDARAFENALRSIDDSSGGAAMGAAIGRIGVLTERVSTIEDPSLGAGEQHHR